ncbi:KEOPS complex kinase/ATPase Bud32 [[Eubacterium] cellulosolvens]
MEEIINNSRNLIRKGAEANLYLANWYGKKVVIKQRVPKRYRVSDLDDRIRKYRTYHEAENLYLARKYGVSTPIVLSIDDINCTIIMEFIEGARLKEVFKSMTDKERMKLSIQIGELIGKLHKNRLIHGDLTSSNMIISDWDRIFLIDFGLSFQSDKIEDMGVDLHLLRRALFSTHHEYAKTCFAKIKVGYSKEVGMKAANNVIKKTEQIERRGRYFIQREI